MLSELSYAQALFHVIEYLHELSNLAEISIATYKASCISAARRRHPRTEIGQLVCGGCSVLTLSNSRFYGPLCSNAMAPESEEAQRVGGTL